ncbi:PepSY domain-containing protein [Marinilabilia rubra]|uniref:PepSY domain-containing protein n=1 Tax=Marinilabilia rubra TaxID=2162893 RepID=A0A2U2B5W5_9BACT|nr:PepSY domain-containing protein [Marinilabilia rubra]PWD98424.1 hypothetical protein DDZ16_15970 [Marinilabilia rubra]
MGNFKKILIKTHKISGLLMSLMFCVWVFSGIILIFEGFPHASREQRFQHLIPFERTDLSGLKAPMSKWGDAVELEMAGDQPVYRVPKGRRGELVYDARTLEPVDSFSCEYAARLSTSYTGSSVVEIHLQDELDQWVPWSYYKPLLPFYKCKMDDEAHSTIYISAKTGSVIQHTTRKGKWLAALGVIPHKLYFLELLQNRSVWKGILIFLASVGLLSAISGIVAGLIRFSKACRNGRMSPYRKLHYKWHHISGFVTGIFVFTFLLSGLISVTGVPDWMVVIEAAKKERINWEIKDASEPNYSKTPLEIWEALDDTIEVRRIKYSNVLGESQFGIYSNHYQKAEVFVKDKVAIHKKKPLSMEEVKSLSSGIFEGKSYEITKQTEYDSYYFPSGMRYQPLPVYKIIFNDASNTWLYIDAATGENFRKITLKYRLRRWLYRGLHTFNFPFLLKLEWLRKSLLLIVSAGLLIVAVTGLVLMWNWCKRKYIN